MPHTYQRPFHKINEFQNQTYSLECDEVTSLSQLSPTSENPHAPTRDAREDDELVRYRAMKHMMKLKMIILVS